MVSRPSGRAGAVGSLTAPAPRRKVKFPPRVAERHFEPEGPTNGLPARKRVQSRRPLPPHRMQLQGTEWARALARRDALELALELGSGGVKESDWPMAERGLYRAVFRPRANGAPHYE